MKLKKLMVLMLSLIMIFSLAACGSSDNSKKKDKSSKDSHEKHYTEEEIIDIITNNSIVSNEKADGKVKELENAQYDMKMTFDMAMNLKDIALASGLTEEDIDEAIKSGVFNEDELVQKMYLDLEMKLESEKDKVAASGKLAMDIMGEKEESELKAYMVMEEGAFISYTYSEEDKEWYRSTETDLSALEEITDLNIDLKDYIKDSKSERVSNDKYKLDLTLDISEINTEFIEMFLDTSSMDTLVNSDMIVNSIKDIKMTLIVDTDNKSVTGLSMDLSDTLKDIFKDYEVEGVKLGDSIVIDKFSIDLEVSKQGKVKVDIPKDVIDNAKDEIVVDWDAYADSDYPINSVPKEKEDEVITENPDKVTISNEDKKLIEVNIPDEFTYDTEYSDESTVVLNRGYNGLWICDYTEFWVEEVDEGKEHEVDEEVYLTDKVEKLKDTIKTSQGTAEIYKRTWSMSKDTYHYDYAIVIKIDKDNLVSFTVEEDELEEWGVTLEELVKEIFNK